MGRVRAAVVGAVAVAGLVVAAPGAAFAAVDPETGPVAGGTEVVVPWVTGPWSVSAGASHSLAVGPDGRVYAWGDDGFGQLGDGTFSVDRFEPGEVLLPAGVVVTSVDAGLDHSLALGPDGTVYAWGGNSYGQVGVDTGDARVPLPVVVGLPEPVTAISAGYLHSLALGADGTVYAWGSDMFGLLGNGPAGSSHVPGVVEFPDDAATITGIAAGIDHSLAVDADGTVYAWGSDSSGQLGNGDVVTSDQQVPVVVELPGGFTAAEVSAGAYSSLALGADGMLYSWGQDLFGQLGDDETLADQASPVEVPGVRFQSVSAGGGHVLGVASDGTTYAWGDNRLLQLGDDDLALDQPVPLPVPVVVPDGVSFTSVAAGNGHSLAVGSDGNLYSWGFDLDGELGDGDGISPRSVPGTVLTPEVVLTSVSFGGVPATEAPVFDEGRWTVTTPPHETAGAVDVVVEWTFGGVPQTPVTYENGFEYQAELAATGVDATASIASISVLLLAGALALTARRATGRATSRGAA